MSGKNRCFARDGYGQRCTIEGAHREIVNSKGQRALSHETKTSMWSEPLSGLHVVGRDETGRDVAAPDFTELADRTQRTTAEWAAAWDALERKEAWPALCQAALVAGYGDPVTLAHKINDIVREYDAR